MGDAALLAALVEVESAWLSVLVDAAVAPPDAADDLTGLATAEDLPHLAAEAEGGGNPVIGLVRLLRARVADRTPSAGLWLHRGLTSQDVMDSALVLCLRDVADQVLADVRRQVTALGDHAQRHRDTLQAGRTLTQHAVPTTFGLQAAGWLTGVLDAAQDLVVARAALPVQAGGAAGTLSAVAELQAASGVANPAGAAQSMAHALADRLGLVAAPPWHTARRPLTRVGDALVACLDAFGAIAGDVTVRSRPEIGELSEPAGEGRGGSSTMPHKQNPVLSVLVRSLALAAPGLGATLHTAAATTVDQRPEGAWHAEWPALQRLGRSCVTAASMTAELLEGLQVHPARMRATVDGSVDGLLSEQQSMRSLTDHDHGDEPSDAASYLGAAGLLVDAALARADQYLETLP
jgi:3-carboxy-cis,cis-muconate cycloisomerase